MPSGIYPRTEKHRKILGKNKNALGKHWELSEETKEKMKIAAKKRWQNSKIRKENIEALKGIKRNKETKRNISKAKEKDWQNPEFREKLSGKNSSNYTDGRTLRKYYCIDCGKELSNYTAKKCKLCEMKKRWENGEMDGIFQSPTKPEKEIMRILESLGIDYIFQFRPKGYSKLYDFYIPKLNLLIEYDSKYWHSLPGMKERDTEKTQYAINNGYKLLRINKKI